MIGIGIAVANYALLLTDWGFGLSATQAVARERNDPVAVNRILWATISAKAFLGLLSSLAIIIGAMLFVSEPGLRAVLIISTLNVVGSILSVDWALRGLEHFTKFAAASIIGRLMAVPLVFLLVHNPFQVAEASFATAAGGLITAGITLTMAHRCGILRRPTVSLKDVVLQIKGGTHIFLSTATISLYTNSLAIALGVTAGVQQVGLFSGADKIRRPVFSLLSPISMVFYPRMNYLAATDIEKARRTGLHILRIQSGIALLLSAALCVATPLAVRVLLGTGFEAAIPVLQILSFLIFIIAVSNVLGLMIMLPFGMKREFTACTIVGAVFGLALVIPLSCYFGAIGASVAAVMAELAVTVAMYSVLARRLDWFSPFSRLA